MAEQQIHPELDLLVERGRALTVLRSTEGWREFIAILGELRALSYLDILNATEPNAIISAAAEMKAFDKVSRIVDESVAQGSALAAQLDAQVEALRQRQAAAQRGFAPRNHERAFRQADAL